MADRRVPALPPPLTARRATVLGTLPLAALLLWSAVTPVDLAVSAPAAAAMQGGNADIRAPDAMRVRSVVVREGERVAAGELMMTLDIAASRARRAAARRAWEVHAAATDRLQAVIRALDHPDAPLPQDAGAARRVLELRSRLDGLAREADALRVELDAVDAQAQGLAALRDIAADRLQAADLASSRGAISRFEWLRAKQDQLSQQAQLDGVARQRAVLVERLAAQRQNLRATRLGQRQALAQEHEAMRVELGALSAAVVEAEERVDHGQVRATVAGVVDRLPVAAGDLVERGALLAVVVPADRPLVFEARLAPAQMAWVRPGQPCRLKLDAVPFARYGTLACTVDRVASDATAGEQLGRHYPVRIVPARGQLLVDGEPFALQPGATATVDIVAGRRTVLSYVTEPLRRFAQQALREP